MIVGPRTPGDAQDVLAAGAALGSPVALTTTSVLVRLAAYLDGVGGSAGEQVVFGRLTLPDDSTVDGLPVTIDSGQAAGWVALPFDVAGLELPAGDYTVSVVGGATGDVTRVWQQAGVYSIFLETIAPYTAPADTPDDYLARLPFDAAQAALGGGSTAAPPRRCSVGWHSARHDPDHEGFFAIARTGGPLDDLVGERIRVTRGTGTSARDVVVWLYSEELWPDDVTDEDFSIAQRAYLELASWPITPLDVTVTVVA